MIAQKKYSYLGKITLILFDQIKFCVHITWISKKNSYMYSFTLWICVLNTAFFLWKKMNFKSKGCNILVLYKRNIAITAVGAASQCLPNERMMAHLKLMMVKCSLMMVKCSSMMLKWVYDNTLISPSLTRILPSLAWSKPSFAHSTIIEKLHRLYGKESDDIGDSNNILYDTKST